MNGKLELTEGVVTALIPKAGGYMDAAVLGDLSGIELGIERSVVYIGENPSYRPDLTLSISMNVETMTNLFYLLATKLGLPAFGETEWTAIAEALRFRVTSRKVDRDLGNAADLAELAERIEAAYA